MIWRDLGRMLSEDGGCDVSKRTGMPEIVGKPPNPRKRQGRKSTDLRGNIALDFRLVTSRTVR